MFTTNKDCEFCDELTGGNNNSFRTLFSLDQLKSRILKETNDFVAWPGLGALSPGYVLVLPKSHIYNMGQLSGKQLDTLEFIVADLRKQIEKYFTVRTIVFEHGAANECKRGGACIDHAHLHICPVNVELEPRIKPNPHLRHTIYKMNELRKWEDKPYLYYENLSGQKYVYELLGTISSQYMRKIVADALAKPDNWDWAIFPMTSNIIKTIEAFSTTSINNISQA